MIKEYIILTFSNLSDAERRRIEEESESVKEKWQNASGVDKSAISLEFELTHKDTDKPVLTIKTNAIIRLVNLLEELKAFDFVEMGGTKYRF